jgi:hypothetical protein
MSEKKTKIEALKVKSFITHLSEEEQQNVSGGYVQIISGKKNNWTYADTRAELFEEDPNSLDGTRTGKKKHF